MGKRPKMFTNICCAFNCTYCVELDNGNYRCEKFEFNMKPIDANHKYCEIIK